MTIKMPLSEGSELRKALEPLTINMVNDTSLQRPMDPADHTIEMYSIAISLKRIADALEKSNQQGVFKR